TVARRYFQNVDPIGRIMRFGRGPARVVGVARDGKYSRINEEPRNYIYVPIAQFYRPEISLIVKSETDTRTIAAAVKSEIARLDPNLPLFDVRTVDEHLQMSTFLPRMASLLLGAFGTL